MDAESLTNYITTNLDKLGLRILDCVSQTYDGASVMSGKLSGVQQRIREIVNSALYVHCYAHRLNLIAVDCCKSVLHAADFFAKLQNLYVFMSGSNVHEKWISTQKEMYPHKCVLELKQQLDTRWSSQVLACGIVSKRFDVVLNVLQSLEDDENRNRATEAQSILNGIDLKFVF